MATPMSMNQLMNDIWTKAHIASGSEKTQLLKEFWALAAEAINVADLNAPYEPTIIDRY